MFLPVLVSFFILKYHQVLKQQQFQKESPILFVDLPQGTMDPVDFSVITFPGWKTQIYSPSIMVQDI